MSTLTLLKKSVKLVKAGRRPLVSAPTDLPTGVLLDRKGNYLLPKSPAARADVLYACEKMRLDLQKRVEKLKKLESELDQYFIDTLPVSQASGIAGQVARVQIKPNPKPIVEDWDKFYAYVKKNNAFDLLQRRVSESAVEERWADKKQVPGVGIFHTKKVSVTKI